MGKNAYILEFKDQSVSVSGFHPDLGTMPAVQVVNALVLFECPTTTQQYLLQINNALYIPQMQTSLIPPIMMRMAGLIVDECPKSLSPNPTIANHSIYSPDIRCYFALQLFFHISYLPIRRPSTQEIQSDLPLVHLTSPSHTGTHMMKLFPIWNTV